MTTRTTLLLVRYRFHVTLPSRAGERTAVAEDAALLAFEGGTSTASWLADDAVQKLLAAKATANVPAAQAENFVARVLDNVADLAVHLDAHGDQLADTISESHRRVRAAAGEIRRGLSVKVERPADLLGIYVFLPRASV